MAGPPSRSTRPRQLRANAIAGPTRYHEGASRHEPREPASPLALPSWLASRFPKKAPGFWADRAFVHRLVQRREQRPFRGRNGPSPADLSDGELLSRLAGIQQARLDQLHAGDDEGAVKTLREIAILLRELVYRDRDTHIHGFATTLDGLADELSSLRRHAEALEPARETEGVLRGLVDRDRLPVLSELARNRFILATALSALGRDAEALEAVREAVALLRELVGHDRETHLPRLADGLIVLSTHRSQLGRPEEALEAAREAVALPRELVERDRKAFLPELSTGLARLGTALNDLDRPEEALGIFAENPRYLRELAGRPTAADRLPLATSLVAEGRTLARLGRHAEAVAAFHESLELVSRDLSGPHALPRAFAEPLLPEYRQACEAAHTVPDAALLARLDA